jgi:DMSO/TMAO reductase YedYZ molybdopterin-dependent catalytic subunit
MDVFRMAENKEQTTGIAVGDAPPGTIVSPDTYRPKRIPPGQSRTKKWPVLDASGPPRIDVATWKLSVNEMVGDPVEWNWREFTALPRVTRWSRLGNVWEGVSTREVLARAGGRRPEAAFVPAHDGDPREEQRHGW